jgi:hypothetical protein
MLLNLVRKKSVGGRTGVGFKWRGGCFLGIDLADLYLVV